MHEHASPGRAVAHQRAALDGLLGSAGLIVVVLANTEVQGAPQNSEYGDKCDAQQGNDDDEDQGCGHGAGIVAARMQRVAIVGAVAGLTSRYAIGTGLRTIAKAGYASLVRTCTSAPHTLGFSGGRIFRPALSPTLCSGSRPPWGLLRRSV
jgi:hypothetical protein